MITIGDIQCGSVREMLEGLATIPNARFRLRTAQGAIHVHSARLAKAIAQLPEDWQAEILLHKGRATVWLFWEGARHGVSHRGQLYLHAIGSPEYGRGAAEALEWCLSPVAARAGWRAGGGLPREIWSAVAKILGPKKYANWTGPEAAAKIKDYGWRNCTDVDVT